MRAWVHKAVALGSLWFGLAAQQAIAGDINLQWDAVQGASGYHVYYGTQSGVYSQFVSTNGTSTSIAGLQDCQTYYLAVKAYNGAGESSSYSTELIGWPRPSISSTTPTTATQGDQLTVDVMGANFQSGATVSVFPNRGTCSLLKTKSCNADTDCQSVTEGVCNNSVILNSITVLSCGHLQLVATIEPTTAGIRPALAGKIDVTVDNPDAVYGVKLQAFEVLVNPYRFDLNRTDATTTNRIDGRDTIFLSRNFGFNESSSSYDPNDDFNGDGWVDGADLSFIASNLGKCWSPATKSWTLSACPSSLQ